MSHESKDPNDEATGLGLEEFREDSPPNREEAEPPPGDADRQPSDEGEGARGRNGAHRDSEEIPDRKE